MFFLLRMAFWVALLLLLVPLGLKGTTGKDIGMFDAFGAVQAVISDASGFCERQPEACAVGGQMVTHLTEKAQASAEWLAEALNTGSASDKAAPGAPAGNREAFSLTPHDLAPEWGGGEHGTPVKPAPDAAPAASVPPRQG